MNTILNPRVELPWPGISHVSRPLGDGVEPIRRLYFLDFPLLLLSVGLVTWMIATDTMLLVSAFTGAVVGLYTLWEIAVRRKPIRFSHVFCVANTVGYGLGVVNSWLTVSRGNQGLAQFFNRDPEAVSHAMAAVLISSGILYSLGEIYETPVFGKTFRLAFDNRIAFFILVGTGLVITGYATGEVGYMGSTAGSNGGHVGLLGGILPWLFPTLFAVTSLSFLEWRKGMLKRFFGVMLAIQFVLIVPTGRRNILYFVLLAIIAARFGSFRLKWSFTRKIVYTVLLASLIAIGATSFYYLRFASWGKHKISLSDQIDLALTLYESGNTAKANESLKNNLAKRTFVLGYVSDLLDASFRLEPAKGRNALHEFQLTIPSAFWADKSAFLYAEENVANMTYHFAYKDEANSLYSAGAIDFGIWGMIFYPIIITALFRIVAEFARVNLPEVAATLVILFLLYNALITEAGLWIRLLAIRDSLLYSILLWLFFKIPAFSMTQRSQEGAFPQ
jgi:hypothetical protein